MQENPTKIDRIKAHDLALVQSEYSRKAQPVERVPIVHTEAAFDAMIQRMRQKIAALKATEPTPEERLELSRQYILWTCLFLSEL